MSARVIDWADLAASPQPNGIVRRRFDGIGVGLVRVELPAGSVGPAHSHPFEQFVQVLSGAGFIETAAGRQPFGPGSVFHFPPDTWHAAEMTADTVLIETNLRPPGA